MSIPTKHKKCRSLSYQVGLILDLIPFGVSPRFNGVLQLTSRRIGTEPWMGSQGAEVRSCHFPHVMEVIYLSPVE